MECIFCKIINKEIPSEFVYEDESVVAFKDTSPQAPIHFLIVPKVHIESNDDIDESNHDIIGQVFLAAKKLAKEYGLSKGYRIVNNCKEDGGQSVNHIHFHLIGGRSMLWPPG
ncbi:MAG: histidine triad nucleotide-binding protein [Tissierellia bacterium]|nr:histidine triad nucleotide-binding protein [Tissierellia bacterium]MDD4725537.1 histidine triad nucleotide-binding protein [Tissierellia bacterium]